MSASSLCVLLLSGSAYASPYLSRSPKFSWQSTKALLAFGDSYTYVQGSEGLQNYSFIGDALDPYWTPGQLLNDTIIQNQIGTSAGGPNWVEYLTKCGLVTEKPLACQGPDQKELWDFAFAGADVSTKYLALHHNYSQDLDTQVAAFSSQAFPYLPVKPHSTLATIFIGINDVSDSAANTTVSFPVFYSQIIGTLFDSVETIYHLGYRSYLFLNLPPLERSPPNLILVAENKTAKPDATQVAEWNSALALQAEAFARNHSDAKVMLFDTYTFLNNVIDHASQYGITNTTGYCANYDAPDIATNFAAYGCLPIWQYFWYNTGHITSHVHRILAEGVRELLLNKESR